MTRIKCLLWDFGDTLCDEKFIWGSGPEWMAVYETFADGGLGESWCLGELDTRAFAAVLARRMNRSVDSVVAHMTERCHHIAFFARTYAFFRARHLPQAIVTVNPDIFSDVIVPTYRLDLDCDAIVTSWQEGTIDKAVLNRIAIERMGLSCQNREALLIDNKRSNIGAWARVGGAGYHYTDDAAFARDASAGLDALSH